MSTGGRRLTFESRATTYRDSASVITPGRMQVARKLKVWVDHHACVGNAMCESIAAKTFRLNDDRQSEVVDPAANTEAEILEAAENCPVSAIFVEDAETGERLFP